MRSFKIFNFKSDLLSSCRFYNNFSPWMVTSEMENFYPNEVNKTLIEKYLDLLWMNWRKFKYYHKKFYLATRPCQKGRRARVRGSPYFYQVLFCIFSDFFSLNKFQCFSLRHSLGSNSWRYRVGRVNSQSARRISMTSLFPDSSQ